MRDINALPTWVYYLTNADGQDIYVGVTCHLESRLLEHKTEKRWWPEVDYIQAFLYPNREQALTWEAQDIRASLPVYNREIPPEPVLPQDWNQNYDTIRCLDFYAEEVGA